MELISTYFPDFSSSQMNLFQQYEQLLLEWNSKINLISRKNEQAVIEQHILHSLSIAKYISFQPYTDVLDLGTGGGLPGIPLAIAFPKTHFHLIDGTGKKIVAVKAMINELNLTNASAEQVRAESHHGSYDFVVTRAVAQSAQLIAWTKHLFKDYHEHEIKNGIIALKGGDLTSEIAETKRRVKINHLSTYFTEDFFTEKKLIHIAMKK